MHEGSLGASLFSLNRVKVGSKGPEEELGGGEWGPTEWCQMCKSNNNYQ